MMDIGDPGEYKFHQVEHKTLLSLEHKGPCPPALPEQLQLVPQAGEAEPVPSVIEVLNGCLLLSPLIPRV